ncbi:MAG: hypothetical protein KGY75_00415 [Candidatus Cloacimonetes bacterium]|nr:hypothetical protein [Candidatus Cloacimonadota bacterium]MBS3766578.1 hypothetical protein [Candidatus Cloacimonadota bacterium]
MLCNKKVVLLLVFLLVAFPAYILASEYVGIFTMINPSAANVAMGRNSGTANIWNKNPLNVWSNPAKLGYFEKFSWAWTHQEWFFDSMYFDSSYLTYGRKGVGVMVPFINNFSKFGTSFDYGEIYVSNDYGQVVDTLHQYDVNSKFALGINCFDVIYNYIAPTKNRPLLFKSIKLSLGYSLNYIESHCPNVAISNPESLTYPDKKFTHDIGTIIHIDPVKMPFEGFDAELSLAWNFINVNRGKLKWSEEDEWYLPYGYRNAVAAKLYFIKLNKDKTPEIFNNYSDYLISLYATHDNVHYGDDPTIWSDGLEVSLLNFFFMRWGEYHDHKGHVVGDSRGFGFNLYFDPVKIQFNFAQYPGGELVAEIEKYDIAINLDIMEFAQNF